MDQDVGQGESPEGAEPPLMISAEDVLEEFAVDEAPPLESEDEGGDEGNDNDGEAIEMPPGIRLVAEYEDGHMEELGGGRDERREPSLDMAAQTFEDHTGPIYAVAIHPLNSRCMLTGGGDDRAFFWELTTTATAEAVASSSSSSTLASSVTELRNHEESVNAVGFSSDGTLAATGAYSGKIFVWDTKTRALLRTLEGPEDIEWLDWHPKGNLLLAGSKDGTVWTWLASTGECVHVFTGHEDGVTVGKWTDDGRLIVSGSVDGSVRVWGPKLGVCKHVFSGYGFHEGPITALTSHPTDSGLLLSGGMDGTARLMHAVKKRVLATMVHSEPKAVAEGGGGGGGGPTPMEEEDVEGEVGGKQEVEGNFSVETVGFSGRMNWCATGGMDGTLKIWDLGNFSCRHVCVHEGMPGVVKLKWHATLPLIYTAATDGVVRVWDARSGGLMLALTGHEDMILDFALHCGDDGMDVILTGSDDGKAKVFYSNAQELQLLSGS